MSRRIFLIALGGMGVSAWEGSYVVFSACFSAAMVAGVWAMIEHVHRGGTL
jgi:hypothetical protein